MLTAFDGALPIGVSVVTRTSVSAFAGALTHVYWALAALNDISFDMSVPWYTNAFLPGGHSNVIDRACSVVHCSVNESAKVTDTFADTTSMFTPTSLVML